MRRILAKSNSGNRGELYLYGDIGGGGWFDDGGITAQTVADALAELRTAKVVGLDIYIDSGGGVVHDGVAIYNQLVRFGGQKTVHVDGLAASIASVIAMAGDEIVMGQGSLMMIHDPSTIAMGTSEDMRKTADILDTIRSTIVDVYVARTGSDAAQIGDWMTEETWMKADECVKRGFATKVASESVVKTKEPTNSAQILMLSSYKHTPRELLDQSSITTAKRARAAAMDMRVRQLQKAAGPSARAA